MNKIYIIEKNKIESEKINKFLEEIGYETFVSNTAGDAIQTILKNPPDIIICDISILDFNCFEFYNILQRIDYTSIIPFIISAEKAKQEEIVEALQLGMDGVLYKPLNYSYLESLVRKKINRVNTIKSHYKNKYSFLIENPFIGVFMTNEYKFKYVNDKLTEITGYNEDTLLNMKLFDIVYDDDIIKLTTDINSCIKTMIQNINLLIRIVTKSKKIVHVHLYGIVKNSNTDIEITGNILTCKRVADNNFIDRYNPPVALTKREKEILDLICHGYTNAEIADMLYISERTVQGHRAHLMDKTENRNTAELINFAIKHGYFRIE